MAQEVTTKNLGLQIASTSSPGYGSGDTEVGQIATALNKVDLAYGNVQHITAAGAINITSGTVILNAGSAAAVTLAAAIAGLPAAGGNDGQVLNIVAEDAFAYTVTTPASGLAGGKHIATWSAAVGNSIQLVAFGGVWYPVGTPAGVALT